MDTKRVEEIEKYAPELLEANEPLMVDIRWLISELRRLQLPEGAEETISHAKEALEGIEHNDYQAGDFRRICDALALIAPALARIAELGAENVRLKARLAEMDIKPRATSNTSEIFKEVPKP